MSDNAVAANPQQNNGIQRFSDDQVSSVLARIAEFQTKGDLKLPPKYSAENAVRSAWLMIQQTVDLNKKPALEVCTKPSIVNALLEMVLNGLSPSKKQCYFIVNGNQLRMQKSYFGVIAMSKRVAGVEEAIAIPIYEKDVFKYSIDLKTGIKTVTEHQQEFDNIDITKLKGAYAIITYEDGTIEYDVMTMAQIRTSWEMGPAKGNSPAHRNFPDQMACRTVINRALKIPVNSSNDDDLFGDKIPGAVTHAEQVENSVKLEIKENANGATSVEPIGFEEEQESQPAGEQESNSPAQSTSGTQIKATF